MDQLQHTPGRHTHITPALAPAPDNWRTPGPSGGPICAALLGQTCEFKLIRQVAWGAMRPNGSRTYSRVRFRFRVRVQVRATHACYGGIGQGIGDRHRFRPAA